MTAELRAAPGTLTPSTNTSAETWLYNGTLPGPELRMTEGEVFEAELTSELSEGTTIHWHGTPVPNAMDVILCSTGRCATGPSTWFGS